MLKIVGESQLPQLLMIHGGGVGEWMWDEVIPLLSPHYQLLIVTLPYHGNTNHFTQPFTIKDYTPLLLDEVQKHRNDQAIGVVGFSLGAQIILELLTIAPSFFSFAMVNSALCTNNDIPFSLIKWMVKFTLPLAKLKSFAKLQARTLYIPKSMFQKYFVLSSSMATPQLVEILHTNMTFTISPAIAKNSSSVHITYGERENRAIKKSASLLQNILPTSTTYEVKGLGHGFPLAEPLLFSNYIIKHYKY